MARSWVEKRDCGKEPHVKVLDRSFGGIKEGCKMLISSPKEIDQFIRSIPENSYIKPVEMRVSLAERHNADATCPVSTGIFLRIVAEAAIEEWKNKLDTSSITPFWRVVEKNSPLAKKLDINSENLEELYKIG